MLESQPQVFTEAWAAVGRQGACLRRSPPANGPNRNRNRRGDTFDRSGSFDRPVQWFITWEIGSTTVAPYRWRNLEGDRPSSGGR
jgi:hypothetical protein